MARSSNNISRLYRLRLCCYPECASYFHKERTMINRRHFTLALAAMPFAAARVAQAQSYPARPIRFIVPFPAGGSTDGGSPLARRKFARRIDRAGEEKAGPSIRDWQRTRIASAHGCAMVRADRGHQTRAGALSWRRAGDQRSAGWPRQAWVTRIDTVDA